jgi:hypothetical protein
MHRDVVANGSREPASDAVRVRDDRDSEVGVTHEQELGKASRNANTFPFLRWQGNHQAVAATFGRVNQRRINQV